MQRVMLVAASQLVFFIYFSWLSASNSLIVFHISMDEVLGCTILFGAILGIVRAPKDVLIALMSPIASMAMTFGFVHFIKKEMLGVNLYTSMTILAVYLTLTLAWFVAPWILKHVLDRLFPEG